ncbi:hypothetical protein ACFQL5_04000 [Aquipuribacter hungaricus]|uniref:hypothetical protein n=1 Tax=Aquipuribacter hungaricus TaxID=545624 RepID=UPI00360917F9
MADGGGWGSSFDRRRRRVGPLGVLVLVVLLAAAVAVAVGLLGERRQGGDGAGGVDGAGAVACTAGPTVTVVVDPTLAPTLRRVVAGAAGSRLGTGACADVEVLAQPSAQTAAAMADDPSSVTDDGAPHLWVPDSSVWLGRAVAVTAPGTPPASVDGTAAGAAARPAPDPVPSGAPGPVPSGAPGPVPNGAPGAIPSGAPSAVTSTAPGSRTALTDLGPLVSSPVVVATRPEVVAAAGWTGTGPSWAQVLASGRPVAVPELAGSAVGLQALLALQASVPDPADRQEALAAAVGALLPDGSTAGPADAGAALALVQDAGGAAEAAPLVPTSEQQVFAGGRGSVSTPAVAVRPTGSPADLDYPLVRVDTPERQVGVDAAAIEGVVRLLETAGREAAVADGFRPPDADVPPTPGASGTPGTSAAPGTPGTAAAPGTPGAAAPGTAGPDPAAAPRPPRWADAEVLLAQVAELRRPVRVLVVLDATASMRGVTATGATRADVTRQAVDDAVARLPGTASVGLWFFAADLGSDPAGAPTGHVEVVPVRPLVPAAAGTDQRAALAAGTAQLPGRLTPGGTGLYETVLAAVRAARDSGEQDGGGDGALRSVLLVTDGRQDDPGAPPLDQVVAALQAEADPARPVPLLVVGLSTDVDAAELTALAGATGGAAYLAEQPEDLPAVLADALRRR